MELANKISRNVLIAATCLLVFSAGSLSAEDNGLGDGHEQENGHENGNDLSPTFQYPNVYNDYLQPVVTAIDYHTRAIYLFNYESEKHIIIDPTSLDGWPGDVPLQHTAVEPKGNKLYITSDNTEDHPSYIIALKINDIDWEAGSVSLSVEAVLAADSPSTPAELPFVEPVNDVQAIPDWIIGRGTQIHGPTMLPHSKYMYLSEWTADKIRVVDLDTNEFASVDPIVIPNHTEQTHGITFNKSGTVGLGTGYFFDNSVIDVYYPNRDTGDLEVMGQIMLGDEERHAAFTHFVYWLDERFALTATMQLDKTSLTPSTTEEIIPPSVWLLDTMEGTATKIIEHTKDVDSHGVYRSASDLVVVNGKLYIAEEDTIDPEYGQDGYISVFDLTDRYEPKFLKRLKPGNELPTGYAVAHTINPTPDGRHILVASYATGYLLKIDTYTDTVVKVWGPDDGLVKPHGIYTAGD